MKKILLFLTMLGLFSLPVMAESTTCVPKTFNGHSYKVFTAKVKWSSAESYCESLGGHLVTITSEEENAFIKTLPNISGAWIGATASSGSWKWVTNESMDYTNWNISDYLVTSYRGTIYVTSSTSSNYGKWSRESYNYTKSFICEWDSQVSDIYHYWQESSTTTSINAETHNITYVCSDCGATKIEGSEEHTWGSSADSYEKADEDTHYRIFKCTKCGVTKKVDAVAHEWNTTVESATEIDDDTHQPVYKCKYCDATTIGEAVEHRYTFDKNVYLDNQYHAKSYKCKDCGHVKINYDEKSVHERHYLYFMTAQYLPLDANYHNYCYPCGGCGGTMTEKEAHQMTLIGYQSVDSSYCRLVYKCSKCGYMTYGSNQAHDYKYYSTVSVATLFQPGTVQMRCSRCGNIINQNINWQCGQNGCISYDITYHTPVYRNTKKLTINLKNSLKGAVLKITIGGKKYTKTLTSDSKTVKVSIKKPSKYGKKVSFALYYNGQLVGEDNCDDDDYIWYATKIKKGMTKNQVKWTWGSPYETRSSSGGWTYWYWKDGSHVYFKNGKVKYWYNAD